MEWNWPTVIVLAVIVLLVAAIVTGQVCGGIIAARETVGDVRVRVVFDER